eukprot:gene25167-biopygen23966
MLPGGQTVAFPRTTTCASVDVGVFFSQRRARAGAEAQRDGAARRAAGTMESGRRRRPPRTPGIPGNTVLLAVVSCRSWRAGPVPARLREDRSPISPKRCWNRHSTRQRPLQGF